jgi:hypothetical protein
MCLRVSAFRLQIQDLLDPGLGEDVMAAADALVEAEMVGRPRSPSNGTLTSTVPLRTWTRRESRLATIEVQPNMPPCA